MDLKKVTDVEKLKALAYDELVKQEQCATNLRAINARILELQEQQIPVEEKK